MTATSDLARLAATATRPLAVRGEAARENGKPNRRRAHTIRGQVAAGSTRLQTSRGHLSPRPRLVRFSLATTGHQQGAKMTAGQTQEVLP
jgi:hypothetical protein